MKSIVIIITHNSSSHISKCLKSLKEHADFCDVCVIDNASTDETLELLEKYSNKITIIPNSMNVGFAKAVNQAIRISKGYDWYILLNPDTEITENSISTLISKKYSYDVRGGLMYKKDKSIHNSHVRFPDLLILLFDMTNLRKLFINNIWHRKFYYLDEKIETKKVDAVSGGFMAINSEIVKRNIEFDEEYFMYLEDIQFCKDISSFGYTTGFIFESRIQHTGGGSSSNRHRINYNAWSDSRRKYALKNFRGIEKIIAVSSFLIDDYISSLWLRLKK